MSARLTVLGSCGAWPEAGRSCSGYLLEIDGFRVVLDSGYGTLPRLLEALGNPRAEGLDAVVITHRHPDHCVDLHGLFRARSLGKAKGPPIPIYAGEGVQERVFGLEEPDGVDSVRQTFDWHALPAEPAEVGPFRLFSHALPHYVPNAGIRLESAGLTVAYTGDSGPDAGIVELARGADLLIAESTEAEKSGGDGADQYLSAAEAAGFAAQAGAKRLLLSHFWPGMDRPEARRAAAAKFDGEILLAYEGAVIPLG